MESQHAQKLDDHESITSEHTRIRPLASGLRWANPFYRKLKILVLCAESEAQPVINAGTLYT